MTHHNTSAYGAYYGNEFAYTRDAQHLRALPQERITPERFTAPAFFGLQLPWQRGRGCALTHLVYGGETPSRQMRYLMSEHTDLALGELTRMLKERKNFPEDFSRRLEHAFRDAGGKREDLIALQHAIRPGLDLHHVMNHVMTERPSRVRRVLLILRVRTISRVLLDDLLACLRAAPRCDVVTVNGYGMAMA